MNCIQKLIQSATVHGNCACMGIDPIIKDPRKLTKYFEQLLGKMQKEGLIPAAFKPNLGFFSCLDRPRKGEFYGSKALSFILDLLDNYFPDVPVIMDAKRGDIARSSLNYAIEAFSCWKADMVTVSPYMGFDSISPFAFSDKGAYVLARTSNPGAKDLQNSLLEDRRTVFEKVSESIVMYNSNAVKNNSVIGAVLGATHLDELKRGASIFAKHQIPILIPGVGSQGGSASEVVSILKEVNYPLCLARINSSSKLTHPFKTEEIPEDGIEQCLVNIKALLEECRC